jgi:hypothetical protein
LQILKANEILADVFISQGRVLENVKILKRVSFMCEMFNSLRIIYLHCLQSFLLLVFVLNRSSVFLKQDIKFKKVVNRPNASIFCQIKIFKQKGKFVNIFKKT